MIDEERTWVERIFAFIDKYPLKTAVLGVLLILLSLTGMPIVTVWKGQTEKVQLAGIDLYRELFLNHCCLPLVFVALALLASSLAFYLRIKAYKREIHEISEEKKRLQEKLLGMRLPPSGNKEV